MIVETSEVRGFANQDTMALYEPLFQVVDVTVINVDEHEVGGRIHH